MTKIIFGLLSILILINVQCNDEEYRVVKMKDFTAENSYLPVRNGQKFIIEVEGNPTTGFMWTLEPTTENETERLVNALNLNEKNSGEYYGYNKKSAEGTPQLGAGGIYHFKFQAHENKSGYTDLTFYHKRPWTEEGSTKHKVVIKVVNLEDKKDL